MNIVPLFKIASKAVPWSQILAAMPSIIKETKGLMNSMKKNTDKTAGLEKNINHLEDNLKQQSEVISKMADQIQEMSEGLQTLTFRVYIFSFISIIAITLVLILLLKQFWLDA